MEDRPGRGREVSISLLLIGRCYSREQTQRRGRAEGAGTKGRRVERTQASLGLLLGWDRPSAAACFLAQYGEPEMRLSVRKEGREQVRQY